MDGISFRITPNDGILPRYNIVLLLPRPDLVLEGHTFTQRPTEFGPCISGIMLGWNRTGLKRSEKKARLEIQRYLKRKERWEYRKALVNP